MVGLAGQEHLSTGTRFHSHKDKTFDCGCKES